MSRRAALPALALSAAALACAAPVARAQGGAPLGDPSRTAALAGAVVARPGQTDAIAVNPGALADLDRSEVSFTVHAGRLDQYFARTGEPALEMDRTIAGFGGGVVGRLPSPGWAPWLSRVRLGIGAHVPSADVLRLSAPPRPDRPTSAVYGNRVARTAATGALGVELPWGIGVGVGVSLTPTLETETLVGYEAGRGDTPDENVVIDVENTLVIESAWSAGLRFAPMDELAFGVAWHAEQAVDAEGPNDVRAGTLVVDAEVDFHELFAPEELAFGAYAAPVPELSLSADVVWSRWSRFRTIHDRPPDPAFEDVVSLRLGVEWAATPAYVVRAGWALEPSPVPEQVGVTNFVDGDRQVIAMGMGFDLERLGWARMRVDLHARWHVVGRQRATKDLDALGDADPELSGRQIDNLGYPGFHSGGSFAQVGVTASFPLEPAGAR